MPEWAYLLIYVAGFLATARLLARYAFDTFEDGLLGIGAIALLWPLLTVPVAFAGLVWLATWGVKRRG